MKKSIVLVTVVSWSLAVFAGACGGGGDRDVSIDTDHARPELLYLGSRNGDHRARAARGHVRFQEAGGGAEPRLVGALRGHQRRHRARRCARSTRRPATSSARRTVPGVFTVRTVSEDGVDGRADARRRRPGSDTYHPAAKDPTPLVIVRRGDPEPQVLSVPGQRRAGGVLARRATRCSSSTSCRRSRPSATASPASTSRRGTGRRRPQQGGGAAGADARHRARPGRWRPTVVASTRCTRVTRPPTSRRRRSCTCSTSTPRPRRCVDLPAEFATESARRGRGVAVGHPALTCTPRPRARSPSSTRRRSRSRARRPCRRPRSTAPTSVRATATEYDALRRRWPTGSPRSALDDLTRRDEWTLAPGAITGIEAGDRRQRALRRRSPTACSSSTRARSTPRRELDVPPESVPIDHVAPALPPIPTRLREVRLLTPWIGSPGQRA